MPKPTNLTLGQLKEFIAIVEAMGGDETEIVVITKKGHGAVKPIVGVSSMNLSGNPALLIN